MKRLGFHGAQIKWSDAGDGNLGHLPPRSEHTDWCCGDDARSRREQFHEPGWLYLAQVHGADVVSVTDPMTHAGARADAAVTDRPAVALGIATADCAPLALVSAEGIVGAVHGGRKGLQAGVVAATADAMRAVGATHIFGALGPCVHVECYEFDSPELQALATQFGASVVGRTSFDTPALDVVEVVRSACAQAKIDLEYVDADCTSCSGGYFSYRARKDAERQVMVVWSEGRTR